MSSEHSGGVTIDSREENFWHEPAEGTKLSRVQIKRSFTGDVEGTSEANLLLAQGEAGGGYMACERFTGSIGGRSGSVVFNHGRLNGGGQPLVTFGVIIPGSGTDGLAGATGTVNFQFSPNGNSVVVNFD